MELCLYDINEIFETCSIRSNVHDMERLFDFLAMYSLFRIPSEFIVIKWPHFIRLLQKVKKIERIEICYCYIVCIKYQQAVIDFTFVFFFLFIVNFSQFIAIVKVWMVNFLYFTLLWVSNWKINQNSVQIVQFSKTFVLQVRAQCSIRLSDGLTP